MQPLSRHCWEAVRLIQGLWTRPETRKQHGGGEVLTGTSQRPANPCVGVQFLPYDSYPRSWRLVKVDSETCELTVGFCAWKRGAWSFEGSATKGGSPPFGKVSLLRF